MWGGDYRKSGLQGAYAYKAHPPKNFLKNEKFHRESAPEHEPQVLTEKNRYAVSFAGDEQRAKYFRHRSRRCMSPTKSRLPRDLANQRAEIEATIFTR